MIINEGKTYKVGIRNGRLGCSDAQDTFAEHGYLLLYKSGSNYKIDTPDGENIICVDDLSYIEEISHLL